MSAFLGTIFAFIFIFSLLHSLATKPPPELTAPQAPNSKIAIFESANQNSTNPPLHIIIGGGNYHFEYLSSSQWKHRKGITKTPPVFTANSKSNEVSGDLESANTIVLHGDWNLSVAEHGGVSRLQALLVTKDNEISAHFNYSRPPPGSPDGFTDYGPNRNRARNITIILIGKIQNINMGDSFDKSTKDITVLDLNPSDKEMVKYQRELDNYHKSMAERRIRESVVRNRSELRGR